MLVAVAAPQAQVEHPGSTVAKLCRKSPSVEVRVCQKLIVEDGHRPATGAGNGKVIGVGNVDALHAPEHPGRTVAAHHNVVARIVRALDAGKVAGHTRGVSTRARKAVGLGHRKFPGRYSGHLVHGRTGSTCGFHLGGAHRHHRGFQREFHHGLLGRVDDDARTRGGLKPNGRDHQGVAAHRNVFKRKAPVKVGHGLDGGAVHHQGHPSHGNGETGFGVYHRAAEGTGDLGGGGHRNQSKKQEPNTGHGGQFM